MSTCCVQYSKRRVSRADLNSNSLNAFRIGFSSEKRGPLPSVRGIKKHANMLIDWRISKVRKIFAHFYLSFKWIKVIYFCVNILCVVNLNQAQIGRFTKLKFDNSSRMESLLKRTFIELNLICFIRKLHIYIILITYSSIRALFFI